MVRWFARALLGSQCLLAAPVGAESEVDLATYQALNEYMKVIDALQEKGFPQVSKKELIDRSVKALLTTLDPHAKLISTQDHQILKDQLRGAFQGIGVVFTKRGDGFLIEKVLPNSPAAHSGLKAGDLIVSVQNISAKTLSFGQFKALLRQKEDEILHLQVQRKGVRAAHAIKRSHIVLNPVTWWVKKDLAYLKIPSFIGLETVSHVKQAMTDIKAQAPQGMIVDFRGNTGGLFKAGIEFCNLFVSNQLITSVQEKKSQEKKAYYAGEGTYLEGVPLILLVDDQTASSAEIVVGCLQDHGLALLIGQKTHGKASVQTVFPVDEQLTLQLTTHTYLTPSGKNIDGHGLVPDFIIPHNKGAEALDEPSDNVLQEGLRILTELVHHGQTLADYKEKLSSKSA